MWEPWIGSGYDESRTLLLGESCYNWVNEETKTLHHPEPDHPSMIVGEAIAAPLLGSRTMIKLTRAICNNAYPSPEQASEGWNRVAFTNYVPVTVGDGARTRPSKAGWKQAEEEWPALLNRLKPQVVIVLGLAMWNRMPRTQTFVSSTVQGYRLEDDQVAVCYAIRHPSWGPGWPAYTAFMAQAFEGAK